MKTLAILFMVLGLLLIAGIGIISVVLFAMSFDVPGSADKPGAWARSAMVFLPLLVFLGILIAAFIAYQSGSYTRSAWIGSIYILAILCVVTYFGTTSRSDQETYKAQQAQAEKDALLYPLQRFTRSFEGGADTILVFPDRIVAYRMPQRGDMPFAYSGPVGDLNETREVIVLSPVFDRRIRVEEFSEFADERGRKLTEVYSVR